MANIFPDITKSLFDNILKNTSSSIANTSSIVNNGGGNTTITIGDITITNPIGNSYDLAKDIEMNFGNAITQQIHKIRK